jgi:hypothetical protein
MQIISEVIKEIYWPIWILWAASFFLIGIYNTAIFYRSEKSLQLALLLIPNIIMFATSIFIMIFFSNDSVKRKKGSKQRWSIHNEILSSIDKKIIHKLDIQVQSIEGIIGYLDQSIKMNYKHEKSDELILFLACEIKKLRDQSQASNP